MSRYAATLMEHGVYTCGQLYAMPYDTVRPFLASDEEYQTIAAALNGTTTITAPTPAPAVPAPQRDSRRVIAVRRNDPYQFNCLLEDVAAEETNAVEDIPDLVSPVLPPQTPVEGSFSRRSSTLQSMSASFLLGGLEMSNDSFVLPTPTTMAPEIDFTAATAPEVQGEGASSTCLVHFKYRQTEYSAPFTVHPGQYVMVSGDRGTDLGLVLRVNTDESKGYVERSGPQGAVTRLAYQKEVDYYNGALRMDEANATDLCRNRVARLGLNMEVHYAEFQYDKKKLTFFYESRARVDFVALLKDLYREFGCRIWMEKVPRNNIPVALA
jgi:hypothetical protein